MFYQYQLRKDMRVDLSTAKSPNSASFASVESQFLEYPEKSKNEADTFNTKISFILILLLEQVTSRNKCKIQNCCDIIFDQLFVVLVKNSQRSLSSCVHFTRHG